MKTVMDLRQGDIFDYSELNKLMNLSSAKLNNTCANESFCVVITQDCDIVHENSEDEPYVEFLIGNTTQNKDSKNGKNPRKLHLDNNGAILEFIVHNRFFVKKDSLITVNFPEAPFNLTSNNKRILQKWLGSRYTRAAFPDEFNRRLKKAKVSKITEKGISAKVSHIFFEVEDRELSSEEKYELNILLVIDSSNEIDKIENAYLDVFDDIEGIDVNLRVVNEDEVTLKDLRNYKRWNKDSISYSKQEQSFPIEEIDNMI